LPENDNRILTLTIIPEKQARAVRLLFFSWRCVYQAFVYAKKGIDLICHEK